jgi:hypothetical protein
MIKKNISKIFGIIAVSAIIMSSLAACKGKTSALEFPIALSKNIAGPPTKELFDEKNLANIPLNDGKQLKTVLKSRSKKGDITIGVFLTKVDGKDTLRTTITLESDRDRGLNFLTGIKVEDLQKFGQTTEVNFDGTERGISQMFIELLSIIEVGTVWDSKVAEYFKDN